MYLRLTCARPLFAEDLLANSEKQRAVKRETLITTTTTSTTTYNQQPTIFTTHQPRRSRSCPLYLCTVEYASSHYTNQQQQQP